MKERPILFSGPMVRAILEGRKTVTRREVKKSAALDCLAAGFEPSFLTVPGNADLCPYGQPGDRLWVRETWARVGTGDPGYLVYRATYPNCLPPGVENVPADIRDEGYRWRPSIHMPRAASRILLEITAVRVERLQEISEEQARAEGYPADRERETGGSGLDAWLWFRSLWGEINGPEAFSANPWVWVVEFKRVTP